MLDLASNRVERVSCISVSGAITARIPSDLNAQLALTTVTSRASVDDQQFQPLHGRTNRIAPALDGPSADLKFSTVGGRIAVIRREDAQDSAGHAANVSDAPADFGDTAPRTGFETAGFEPGQYGYDSASPAADDVADPQTGAIDVSGDEGDRTIKAAWRIPESQRPASVDFANAPKVQRVGDEEGAARHGDTERADRIIDDSADFAEARDAGMQVEAPVQSPAEPSDMPAADAVRPSWIDSQVAMGTHQVENATGVDADIERAQQEGA